jgi:hypothetical protein
MADNNAPGQQAEDTVDPEPQQDGQLREDRPPSHSRSIEIWAILRNNYMNVLLLFIPVGLVTGALGAPGAAVFIFNFISLMQLAAVIDFATHELAASAGVAIGGLLQVLARNPVEIIVRGSYSEGSFSVDLSLTHSLPG